MTNEQQPDDQLSMALPRPAFATIDPNHFIDSNFREEFLAQHPKTRTSDSINHT